MQSELLVFRWVGCLQPGRFVFLDGTGSRPSGRGSPARLHRTACTEGSCISQPKDWCPFALLVEGESLMTLFKSKLLR